MVSGDLWISVLSVFVDPVLLCAVHSHIHAVLCDHVVDAPLSALVSLLLSWVADCQRGVVDAPLSALASLLLTRAAGCEITVVDVPLSALVSLLLTCIAGC